MVVSDAVCGGTVLCMRRLVLVLFVVALAVPGSADAMSSGRARALLKPYLRQRFDGFTEHTPHIRVWCHPGRVAHCHATYRGDRLRMRVRARVRQYDGYAMVWLDHMCTF